MTSAPANPANYCYRHPDRQSFVLCQRCGRTVCPQCQTQAAVGVHCPECVKEGRASGPRRPSVLASTTRATKDQPVITWSIIGLCVLIYVLQLLPNSPVTSALLYYPPYTYTEPWRMVTALFVHSPTSFLHILFNMYSLFVIGPMMERIVGRVRFLALYLLSGFGGSVAVLLLAPGTAVVGASGAIFGLLAALFLIQRKLGGNSVQLLIVIGLNLVIGFLPGVNVAWQAHVGGLVVGGVVALVYLRTRRIDQRTVQILAVTGVFVALVVLTLVRLYAF
ncbi:MAG: Membrane associated serine protease, rhomboid family [Rhodoglobus sp.]|nr:Membrane associated serine protease, rhomboid family [Rhodoglobus sp.]